MLKDTVYFRSRQWAVENADTISGAASEDVDPLDCIVRGLASAIRTDVARGILEGVGEFDIAPEALEGYCMGDYGDLLCTLLLAFANYESWPYWSLGVTLDPGQGCLRELFRGRRTQERLYGMSAALARQLADRMRALPDYYDVSLDPEP